MNRFARAVSYALLVGMAHLTIAEALAQSAGTGGAAGASGASGAAGASGGAAGGNGGGGATGGGGGGSFGVQGAGNPAFGVTNGACGTDLRLPNPATYKDTLRGVEEISRQTQAYIERCGCATQACIADALDTYADALQKIAPRLPVALRALPKIIHQAAQKARAAPTARAAVKVLRAAVVVVEKAVRKTIALMRASDPDATNLATRGGDLVASTLATSATVLERADTL